MTTKTAPKKTRKPKKSRAKGKAKGKPSWSEVEAAAKRLGVDLTELEGMKTKEVTPPSAKKSTAKAGKVTAPVENKREKIEAIRKIVADAEAGYLKRYTGMSCWRVKYYGVNPTDKKWPGIKKAVEALPFVSRCEFRKNEGKAKAGEGITSLVAYLV